MSSAPKSQWPASLVRGAQRAAPLQVRRALAGLAAFLLARNFVD